MIRATLYRTETSDQGTFGILEIGGLVLRTAEPPWRENRSRVSCIPQGIYQVLPRTSRRFLRHFHVAQVPDRTMILIHTGNLAGDKSLGYRTDSSGCILVGKNLGQLQIKKKWQRAVLASRSAMGDLLELLDGRPFELEIKGVI